MPSDGGSPSAFADLPPSAKYVFTLLDRDGPLSRQTLLARTGLPERTLDDALDVLEKHDYIAKTRDSGDLRRVVAKTMTIPDYTPPQD